MAKHKTPEPPPAAPKGEPVVGTYRDGLISAEDKARLKAQGTIVDDHGHVVHAPPAPDEPAEAPPDGGGTVPETLIEETA